jgi:hypothetical protein
VDLTASPAAGPAGTPVTLTLQVRDATQITARHEDGTFVAHVCFSSCGRAGGYTGVQFKPVPGSTGTFTAE